MWTQDTEQRQTWIDNPETRTTFRHKTQNEDKQERKHNTERIATWIPPKSLG